MEESIWSIGVMILTGESQKPFPVPLCPPTDCIYIKHLSEGKSLI
jgi:hypothetical protein